MRRSWGMLTVLAALGAAPAGPWLPDLVRADGLGAVAPALRELDAAIPPGKKHDKALAATGLDQLTMPTKAMLGAELSLRDPTPLGGCTWDGSLHCGVSATGAGDPAGFDVKCRIGAGVYLPLASRPAPSAPGTLAWVVDGVEGCWKLPAEGIVLVPRAEAGLEGVGQGDEFIPPEIIGLSQDQVEATLKGRASTFAACTRRNGKPVAGKMVVDYRIAEDGAMAEAKVASSTFGDAAIEKCVTDAFLRLRFPKVNGGYDHGSFPLTFLGS